MTMDPMNKEAVKGFVFVFAVLALCIAGGFILGRWTA